MITLQVRAEEMGPTAMSLTWSNSKHIGILAGIVTRVTLGNSINIRISLEVRGRKSLLHNSYNVKIRFLFSPPE